MLYNILIYITLLALDINKMGRYPKRDSLYNVYDILIFLMIKLVSYHMDRERHVKVFYTRNALLIILVGRWNYNWREKVMYF